MTRRVLGGIVANGYGQAVTIAVQLASVPLLVRCWGADAYGAWVLLTAIPTALAFADGGLVAASGTAMAMATGKGDTGTAAALYRATLGGVRRTMAAAAALAAVAILVLPVADLAPGLARAGEHPGLVLAALVAVTLAGTAASLPGAALRAGGRYAQAVAGAATVRLVESLAVIGVALSGGGLLAAACAWLAARVAGTVWQGRVAHRRLPWLRDAVSRAPAPSLQPLVAPALASVAMPAAFALALQGVTVAVGLALSPVAVAQFAATRTLVRAAVQCSGLVNHTLMPELSRLAGRGDAAAVHAMARLNGRVCAAILATAWLATILFGPTLMAWWTHGCLLADPVLLDLLATAAVLHGLWLGSANCLLAVNRQGEFSWFFLVTALGTALLAWPVAAAGGLYGVAALTLAGEGVMVAWLWLATREPLIAPDLAEGVAA